MAREQIPVNKKLIEWARKRAGLTLAEAAVKFNHIAAWETGTSFPTYPQLERLADEFKLPVAVFFSPKPPTLPPIRVIPHVARRGIRPDSAPSPLLASEGQGFSA
jgi:transcriptional regulator with XRE-family HTH domain